MATIKDTFGEIRLPQNLMNAGFDPSYSKGSENINKLLDNVIGLFFAAAGIAFIIMFTWGAVQMILSGGDKEAIAKAKSKITWAIIGVVLLSLSYFIFLLLETITGFKFFV